MGLVPAAIVGLLLLGGLVALGPPSRDHRRDHSLGGRLAGRLGDGGPGHARHRDWSGRALVLVAVSFTALTLISRRALLRADLAVRRARPGRCRRRCPLRILALVLDGLGLFVRGLAIAVLAALIGLIPAVGGILSTVFAVLLTGWLLADELSSRALTGSRPGPLDTAPALRAHRARVLGFGVATQLCFMVPLGAVATMPAAVAGSTALARSLLEPARTVAG